LRPPQQEGTLYVEAERPVRVRLAESDVSPAELPPGTAAFTTFLEPIVQEGAGSARFELELRIHEDVCAAEHFEELYVYAYHPVMGW
ncbi:MAG: hypothetical protein GWN84_16080, partial [Gammaproteobacteria bacterium]|nr:hypothetical protein [Gammaproteobacteria bacterium]NIR84306.1 hypothetical protein [Gammaproteobacteria bacterium]NIU05461.1 hypothetical protein [Gammaproteobacteria bacterium]NIX86734.1 hypothetical protein [Gammaproteobacteria bacterium]